MRSRLTMIVVVVLCMVVPRASAHRLDEYLQATTIFVDKDHIGGLIRLTPGVNVLPTVLPKIDSDGDGRISDAEQQAYARRVLGDLSLKIDGRPLFLQLVSSSFGAIDDMREGLGEIDIRFAADLPPGGASERALVFENHHQSKIAAYMVNCLAPNDPHVRVLAQKRNYDQSFYELDYEQTAGRSASSTPAARSRWRAAFSMGACIMLLGIILIAWTRAARARRHGPLASTGALHIVDAAFRAVGRRAAEIVLLPEVSRAGVPRSRRERLQELRPAGGPPPVARALARLVFDRADERVERLEFPAALGHARADGAGASCRCFSPTAYANSVGESLAVSGTEEDISRCLMPWASRSRRRRM